MSLAQDLLSQSFLLATIDKGRPRQVNLRRAVSAAYYAVFHLLISEAAHLFAPARPHPLVSRIARSFQHGEVKQACILFLRSSAPEVIQGLLTKPISSDLQALAALFVELQKARHGADYDLTLDLSREEVLARLSDAQSAFTAWKRIRGTDEGNVFLAALAFGARWSR